MCAWLVILILVDTPAAAQTFDCPAVVALPALLTTSFEFHPPQIPNVSLERWCGKRPVPRRMVIKHRARVGRPSHAIRKRPQM